MLVLLLVLREAVRSRMGWDEQQQQPAPDA
jgi:hypothetical protein